MKNSSMKLQVLLCALIMTTMCAFETQAATIIYSDTFNRTGALVGTAPDIVQTPGNIWAVTGSNNMATNGTSLYSGNSLDQTSYLPFTLTTGQVYTLSITLNTISASTGWLGIGFGTGGSRYNTAGQTSAWGFLNVNGAYQAFGNGLSNQFANASMTATMGSSYTLSVVLDTTAALWTASYFIDGIQRGTTYTYTSNPTITTVFIGSNGLYSAAGTYDNFSLTAVPEPATLGLLAAGGGLLVMVRLRQRR